ncbi:MAG TPA: alpha/beta hydrolase [Bacilli bacterium]|jgi:alpha-beta hydrolase superfamily lysophospholipase|nr:alpha/beta hydrolase [Bacilli bacterium]MDD3389266.1 alpha/beta hydrolase [Bacilli bacterium]MDD4344937.1 alpha/beta hydrolase [Bacilli bacterium]MDY0399480.1 alpha/beta hydrolase [Bacilli bacterium]HKM11665.1 alpha/beta hydrolase [Bacilli bacterium]
MAEVKISMVKNDGSVFYGRSWPVEKPTANVVILTGMEEHTGRYNDFASFLNSQGYSVFSLDFYGQGMNVEAGGQKLGCVPESAFRKFVYTIDELVQKLRASSVPIYLIGHSMGSFMLQDYAQRFGKHVDKIVLTGTNGPMFTVKIGYLLARLTVGKKSYDKPSKLLAAMAIGGYQNSIKDRKNINDWISYNSENVETYTADSLSGKGSSKGFYREFLKGLNRLYRKKFLNKIDKDLPIAIFAGADDPVGGKGKGVTKLFNLYQNHGLKNLEHKIYPNMRHEVLNEVNKQEVYQDILAFLKKDFSVSE